MEPFQAAGLALVVAAIVGGGLKAAGFEIGVVQSLARQMMLGGLGAVLFVSGTPQVWSLVQPAPPVAPPPLIQTIVITPTPAVTLTVTPLKTTTAAPSATVPPEPTATPAVQPTATQPPTAPVQTSAPAQAAPAQTSAPAPAVRPTLPAIRKDGIDRRP